MQITIKCGTNEAAIDTTPLNLITVGDVLESSVLRQMFGYGDNMQAAVNNIDADSTLELRGGDTVSLSSRAGKKG